jgi:hypothetical protein
MDIYNVGMIMGFQLCESSTIDEYGLVEINSGLTAKLDLAWLNSGVISPSAISAPHIPSESWSEVVKYWNEHRGI